LLIIDQSHFSITRGTLNGP